MPAFLLRYLPHTLIVLAVLGGVWWIYDSGHDAAERAADARNTKLRAEIYEDILAMEHRSIDRENERATDTKALLDRIARNTADGPAHIIKEMTHEVRFTDPALGIPASVREEINRAIAASTCTSTPAGGIRCTVQDAGAAAQH